MNNFKTFAPLILTLVLTIAFTINLSMQYDNAKKGISDYVLNK